jgi:hypothetical protein
MHGISHKVVAQDMLPAIFSCCSIVTIQRNSMVYLSYSTVFSEKYHCKILDCILSEPSLLFS